jgi:hypothetical protein
MLRLDGSGIVFMIYVRLAEKLKRSGGSVLVHKRDGEGGSRCVVRQKELESRWSRIVEQFRYSERRRK